MAAVSAAVLGGPGKAWADRSSTTNSSSGVAVQAGTTAPQPGADVDLGWDNRPIPAGVSQQPQNPQPPRNEITPPGQEELYRRAHEQYALQAVYLKQRIADIKSLIDDYQDVTADEAARETGKYCDNLQDTSADGIKACLEDYKIVLGTQERDLRNYVRDSENDIASLNSNASGPDGRPLGGGTPNGVAVPGIEVPQGRKIGSLVPPKVLNFNQLSQRYARTKDLATKDDLSPWILDMTRGPKDTDYEQTVPVLAPSSDSQSLTTIETVSSDKNGKPKLDPDRLAQAKALVTDQDRKKHYAYVQERARNYLTNYKPLPRGAKKDLKTDATDSMKTSYYFARKVIIDKFNGTPDQQKKIASAVKSGSRAPASAVAAKKNKSANDDQLDLAKINQCLNDKCQEALDINPPRTIPGTNTTQEPNDIYMNTDYIDAVMESNKGLDAY